MAWPQRFAVCSGLAGGVLEWETKTGEAVMSFALYILGFLVLIGGVAWALITVGLATLWVVIISVILFGIGMVTGVTRTRSKDLPAP